jgi:ankyrin repeat protein
LLKAGADPNARDHEAATPLHIAARAGSAQVIAALLEAGADPNIPATAGRTALDIAYAEQRPAEVLFLLREHGGRCNWDC